MLFFYSFLILFCLLEGEWGWGEGSWWVMCFKLSKMHSQRRRGNGIIGEMSNHPSSRARISFHPKFGPELVRYCHSCRPHHDTNPPLFDMLIVAVGWLELAREQRLSDGWHVTKLRTSKPSLKGSVLIQQNQFAFYNGELKIPTN